jgi:hypothetical protein
MFRVQSPSRRWTWPTLSTATAGLLILLLTLDLARPSRMNAAQVLSAASEWESSSVEGREVLYRRYRLTTRSAAGTEPRTLAVWRSLATRERRLELSDGRGKVIATSLWRGDVPSPTAENLWQFEPAADVFEALAPKGELIAVSTNTAEIRLGTSTVDMSVDRDTHRPKMLTIRRGGEELRVSEISHEALPSLPPAALIALPAAVSAPASPRRAPKAERQPGSSLDEIELAVRHLLMRRGLATSVSITSVQNNVRVELPSALAAEIERELLSLGSVTIAHIDPAAAVALAVPLSDVSPDPVPAPKQDPLLKSELIEHFGNIEAAAAWTDELRVLGREINSLTGALVDLARRYPAEVEPLLLPEARGKLIQIVSEAEDRLRVAAQRLMLRSGALHALRVALSSPPGAPSLAPGWRERALQLSALAWDIQSSSMHLLIGVESDQSRVDGALALRAFAGGCFALTRIQQDHALAR